MGNLLGIDINHKIPTDLKVSANDAQLKQIIYELNKWTLESERWNNTVSKSSEDWLKFASETTRTTLNDVRNALQKTEVLYTLSLREYRQTRKDFFQALLRAGNSFDKLMNDVPEIMKNMSEEFSLHEDKFYYHLMDLQETWKTTSSNWENIVEQCSKNFCTTVNQTGERLEKLFVLMLVVALGIVVIYARPELTLTVVLSIFVFVLVSIIYYKDIPSVMNNYFVNCKLQKEWEQAESYFIHEMKMNELQAILDKYKGRPFISKFCKTTLNKIQFDLMLTNMYKEFLEINNIYLQ